MKPFRLLLIGAAVAAGLLLIAMAVGFNSSFQTWAARKALAAQPEMRGSVGSISAGFNHVEAKDLRFQPDGALLTIPSLRAELPLLSAGLRKKVAISRLVAKGWTLDLSRPNPVSVLPPGRAGSPIPGTFGGPGQARPSRGDEAAAQAFAGLLSQLKLPVEFSLDGVDLEGEVILPAGAGRVKTVMRGGDLVVGREGKFDLMGEAALADPKVNAVTVRGTVSVTMDSPKTVARLVTKLEATARGTQFPRGVKLAADLAAVRNNFGESFSAALVTDERSLLRLDTEFSAATRRLDGSWKVDVRDGDVAPFLLGAVLPAFNAMGGGKIESDGAFHALRANGQLDLNADRLGVVRKELAAVGPVKLGVEFDLTRTSGAAIKLDRLNLALAGAQPVATVRALQPFTIDLKTRKASAADPASELLIVELQGVPLAWTNGAIPDLSLSGSDLRGVLAATTQREGFTLRTKTPLTIGAMTVTRAEKPLLRQVDLSFQASADYTPQGWQTEIAAFTLKSGAVTLLTLDGKAGQLVGAGEAIKATGKISANLPPWLEQPVANGTLGLRGGEATVDFLASFGLQPQMEAKLAVVNLVADPKLTAEKLPAIFADLRADFASGGRIVLQVPLRIERSERKSDLAFAGTLTTAKDKLAVDAQVTSANFVIDDARVLAALIPPAEKPAAGGTKPARDSVPLWAGISGSVALALKNIVYSDTYQVSDVKGELRIEEGAVKLVGMRAGLDQGGEVSLEGAVKFEDATPQPYSLAANLTVREFSPAPLFRAINPNQPATVEGKFDVTSTLAARAGTLGELAGATDGDFHLTSRGGNFRLPVSVVAKVTNYGAVAAAVARLGTLASALGGKNDRTLANVASNAEAVAALVKNFNPIAYDQLNVVVARDHARNTVLRDFTLIAPEIRLSGTGQATHRPGLSLLDEALAMEFKLRARGYNAELLKHLGVLDPEIDDLGYGLCTLPLKIGGTLRQPDTGDLNERLTNLALEKSGVTDKAADLINKMLGGGK